MLALLSSFGLVLGPVIEPFDEQVDDALESALEDSAVPGALAAIVEFGEAPRIGVYGVRKEGTDVAMTTDDLVHIGSDTKAMTAVLIARLIDQEKLTWESTLADVLPELAADVHQGYRDATVLDFLRHTSGAPANALLWWAFPKKPLRERRIAIARANLKSAPAAAPGEAYQYSNLGVMIAGAMAEEVADATWEDLMQREVFGPLEMSSAGFGVVGVKGETDQPWGHRIDAQGEVNAIQADNAEALGPAGTVHLTMGDWAKFAMEFTERAAEESEFLSSSSRKKLVEVGLNGYACGWSVRKAAGGATALSHAGSNTTWFATIGIVPSENRAMLIAVNAMGPDVPILARKVEAALVEVLER